MEVAEPGRVVEFESGLRWRVLFPALVQVLAPPVHAVHIAATLLVDLNLDITRGYTGVFPGQVIAARQFLIGRRRRLRPFGELRPASGEEWDEFEQHFLLRKVALGDCHRPYGTPCVHEQACSRCRFLRVDPASCHASRR